MWNLKPPYYPYGIYHRVLLDPLKAVAYQGITIPRGHNFFLDVILAAYPETGGPPTNFSTPRLQIENIGTSKLFKEAVPIPLFSTPGVGGAAAQYKGATEIDWPYLWKDTFRIIITEFNPLVVSDYLDIMLVGRAVKI